MTRISIKSLLTLAAALVVLVGLGSATAGQDDGQSDTRVRIEKKIINGDGEEMIERKHVVFIGEDGKTVEFKGEGGEGMKWVFKGDSDEDGEKTMVFIGGDGETVEFKGHHGEDFSWTSDDVSGHRMRIHEMLGGGFLGVQTTELTSELRGHFGVPEDSGVMVSKVVDDSGAFRAGVLVGDIITAVDSEAIASAGGLQKAIRVHEEGDSVTLEIWRDGRVQNLTAIVGETEGMAMRSLHSSGNMFFSKDSLHEAGEALHRSIKVNCDSEDSEDCTFSFGGASQLCDDQEECEVTVSCEEDICTCEVNGVESECDDLEGVHVRHHD